MRSPLAAKQVERSAKGARKTDGPGYRIISGFDIWSVARCNASAAKAEPMLRIGEIKGTLGQEQQFTLILQTLQQLKDVYGDSVDKIVQGNTSNIVKSHAA